MICAVGHETLSRVVDNTMWGVLAANRAYAISLFEGIRSWNGRTRSGLAWIGLHGATRVGYRIQGLMIVSFKATSIGLTSTAPVAAAGQRAAHSSAASSDGKSSIMKPPS